ncbi:MAG TPA: hypothetical protein VIG80_10660 [Bacillaceae bacterium]
MSRQKNNHQENEWIDWLSEYSIEYPDGEKIEDTIFALHAYVPERKKQRFLKKLPLIVQNAFHESLNMSRTFWAANLIHLMAGLLFVVYLGGDPFLSLFVLAPIPFIIGLLDVFRSRDEGMIELELSFRYSHSQVILARLGIVGAFNLACNLLLWSVFHLFAEPVLLMEMLIYWAVPYTLMIAMCLFLSLAFKSIFAAPVSLAMLFILGMAASQFDIDYKALPGPAWLAVFLAALFALYLEVNFIKRGRYHEFSR